jgi:hypothetical protein
MPTGESELPAFLARLLRAGSGIKLGPGVLGTIHPVNIVGFLAIAVLGWALSGIPLLAGGVVLVGFVFMLYLNERSFRYAEDHPIPAIMSGTEVYNLIRDQISAKDKSIIVDTPPVVAASSEIVKAAENGT